MQGGRCLAWAMAAVLLAVPVAAAERQRLGPVAEVRRDLVIVTADGQELRPDGLLAADAAGAGDEAALAAQARLQQLIGKGPVEIPSGDTLRDRHNRAVVQLWTARGDWVQQRMLAEGLALYLTLGPDLPELRAAEAEAQQAGRGLWQQRRFQPLPAVGEMRVRSGSFRRIEGTVAEVVPGRRETALHFGSDRDSDVTAYIDAADLATVLPAGAEALVGRTVRLRGFLYWRGGPALSLTSASQIED